MRRGREVDALECKMNPERFDPESLTIFRASYPDGLNYLVCPGTGAPYDRRFGPLTVRVTGTLDLLTITGQRQTHEMP